MGNTWFRFYDDVLYDMKIQKLPLELFKAWVHILCLASKNGGEIPDTESVSYAFRATFEDTQKQIDSLIVCGLIDKVRGKLFPHNWFKRQYKSDKSTERVKRFRETQLKRFRNVTETPQNRAEQSRTEQTPIVPKVVRSVGVLYSPDFENFWKIYPKRVGKGKAFTSWKRINPDFDLNATISASILKQSTSVQWMKDNGQFIPNPATFLNERRWEDEPTSLLDNPNEYRPGRMGAIPKAVC